MYRIEYQKRNGEWVGHSGHAPLPEAEAMAEARAMLNHSQYIDACLVNASTGNVYRYVKPQR
jgi:hypothetical protein